MLQISVCNTSKQIARLGGDFCNEEQIVGFNLYKRGVTRDPATFDKEALDELVSQDKFIGRIEVFKAEPNSEDPGFTASPVGDRYKTTPGSVRWTFDFGKGTCFHKELSKLDGSSDYEITFVDIDGKELSKQNKDGSLSGFRVNLFVDNRKLKLGAEDLPSRMMVDLLAEEIKDWNNNAVYTESDEFSYNKINPITKLKIAVPNLVDEATSTKIKVTKACSDVQVSGLTTATNWKIKRNGVIESITSMTGANGEYTIQHTALNAGEKISFLIYVAGYPVYVADTEYYVGESESETVA